MKRILGITAHSDDHVVFAGTIFKLQKRGYQYFEAIMTSSEEGQDYREEKQSKEEVKLLRETELQKASKLLGTKKLFHFDQEDQGLTYSKEIMHRLVKVVREVKPEIVISMNSNDVHPDHIVTNHIAREALRWAAKKFRPELGKPHRTNIALFAEGTQPIEAQLLVDITEHMDDKVSLFRSYASQASDADIDLLRSTSLIRGYHLRRSDSNAAEAFSVEKNILPVIFD